MFRCLTRSKKDRYDTVDVGLFHGVDIKGRKLLGSLKAIQLILDLLKPHQSALDDRLNKHQVRILLRCGQFIDLTLRQITSLYGDIAELGIPDLLNRVDLICLLLREQTLLNSKKSEFGTKTSRQVDNRVVLFRRQSSDILKVFAEIYSKHQHFSLKKVNYGNYTQAAVKNQL